MPGGRISTIVYDQTTLWSGGFGLRNGSDPRHSSAPGRAHLVRTTSIIKVFTDMLAYKLCDAGTVSLDDPSRGIFPA